MEISYVYSKKRSEFGKQCNFTDKNAEVIIDIIPDPELTKGFIKLNPIDSSIQCSQEMSVHEINTEGCHSESRGINHTEGGWPKDINPSEPDQVIRYRKKVEKDENYVHVVHRLESVSISFQYLNNQAMEHSIKQNNALDIYELYFEDTNIYAFDETPTAKSIYVLKDHNEPKRSILHVSWFPDSPTKVAAAYCNNEFQQFPNACIDSYIWDLTNPNKPEMILKPSSCLVCIEFNPKDSHTLIGGCYNGQVAFWDRRKGCQPVEISPIVQSHKDPAWKVLWIQSKTGTECFSAGTDGQVLWWDVRKISEPIETIYLDPTKKQDVTCAQGAYVLEYEPTMPTKFMAGTEQGNIINCNRKGKTPAEKVTAVYQGHLGPIYALQRNPFFPKNFLSIGDWSARIWSEDVRDSSIVSTNYHKHNLTDGCWSPIRPGVFFTTGIDGCLNIWDITMKQKSPSLTIQVSDDSLHCLKVQEQGCLVATGSNSGTCTILELSECFYVQMKNEKSIVNGMFERETHREKILEARHKELRVKKSKSQGYEEPKKDDDEENGPKQIEKLIKTAEDQFFNIVDQKRKEIEKVEKAFDDLNNGQDHEQRGSIYVAEEEEEEESEKLSSSSEDEQERLEGEISERIQMDSEELNAAVLQSSEI